MASAGFSRLFVWLVACLAMHATAATASDAREDGEVVAIWKEQQITFEYRGFTTIYSCRTLHGKLKVILMQVGAREGMELRNYYCDEMSGTARFRIKVESPVIATVENVQARATHSATDELLARVNGEQLETVDDVQKFPAVWRTVSFARDRRMQLLPSDCELVNQVRLQILPRLSVRVLKDNVFCSPYSANISPPRLTVAALVADTRDADKSSRR